MNQHRIVRLKETECLNCKKLLDAHSSFDGASPVEGDVTLCAYCGEIMAYDKDLNFRPLTDEEIVIVAGDEDIIAAQKFCAKFREIKDEKEKSSNQAQSRPETSN